MSKKDKNDLRLIGYIKDLHIVWDSIFGRFSNIITVVFLAIAILTILGVVDIIDATIALGSVIATAMAVFVSVIVAIFKVWQNQKTIITKSTELSYDIKFNLKRLSLERYKEIIFQRIKVYGDNMANLPKGKVSSPFNFMSKDITKEDYEEAIKTLSKYLLDLERFEHEYSKIFLINIPIGVNKTEYNIDVSVKVSGGYFIETMELVFPGYPIRSRGLPNVPIMNNIAGVANNNTPYRTGVEVEQEHASCNLKYIKLGQTPLFMNELLVVCSEEKVKFEAILNSDNSGGDVMKVASVNIESIKEPISFMDLENFEYLAGDYK